jgi:hypothetical protein
MIGQYLPNNNETATVAFRQKFCQLNSLNGNAPITPSRADPQPGKPRTTLFRTIIPSTAPADLTSQKPKRFA